MEVKTPQPNTETLLIVDDEPLMTDLFRQMMSRQGYTVLTANGGREALSLLEGKEAEVSLIVMDMNMPDMNGLETAQALQQQTPGIPILIATGLGADVSDANVPSNVIGIVQKPYQGRTLAERIRTILDSTGTTL
jgi:CheY-like chemotaxis protein